ncbi:MAG: hypothetical protein AAB645_01535 [Patescibacteria group bacterium]
MNNLMSSTSLKTKILIGLTALFLVFFAWGHLHLVSDTFYIDPAGSIHSNYEGYGDTPLHLTQISKFAFSKNLDLNEPVYYGHKLQYPFLINLISGLLLRLTGLWSFSVLWPIYVLVITNIILLYLIYKKLLGRNFLVIAAFLIFFLGGGTAAWSYLKPVLTGNQPVSNLVQTITEDQGLNVFVKYDAKYPDQNIDFSAPLTLVLTHQRTFFLGLFGFLLFVWFLIKSRESDKKKYPIWAGIVFGLLPLAHTHSFVAAAVVLFVFLIWHSNWKNKEHFAFLKKLLFTFIVGVLLALPQLYFLLQAKNTLNTRADFARFRLGWMTETGGIGSAAFPTIDHSVLSWPYLHFLWINLGLILPLFLLALILTVIYHRRLDPAKNSLLWPVALSGLLLFGAVQIIQFQPWDFDNNKILVYFLFCAAPFVIWFLAKIFGRLRWLEIFIISLVVLLSTYSGLIGMASRLSVPKENLPVIFTPDSEVLAAYIKTKIPEQDLILTGTTHLNPVSSLAGRQVLVGYPGWLWTRGIDYSARENKIRQFYQAPSFDSHLLREFPISYILMDNSVINNWYASPATFDQLFPRVFTAGQYILYKVI